MKKVQTVESTSSDERGEYQGPRSPLRVMQIVELLAELPNGLALMQLTERLEIPKTSLLSQLRVLQASEYLRHEDGRYFLGPAAHRMGMLIAANASVPAVTSPLLEELVQSTGETAMLAMLDLQKMEMVYVARVEGTHAVRFSPSIGARRPLYCTAFGRALLAHQDEEFLARYLSKVAPQRITSRTVTSERALRQILQSIKSSGLALTQEEHTRDAGAIAAPVIERGKPVSYAIGIALPVARLDGPRTVKDLEDSVKAIAAKARHALAS